MCTGEGYTGAYGRSVLVLELDIWRGQGALYRDSGRGEGSQSADGLDRPATNVTTGSGKRDTVHYHSSSCQKARDAASTRCRPHACLLTKNYSRLADHSVFLR